jgi:hypothetical protein
MKEPVFEEIILEFEEEDFWETKYLDGEKCAITLALERYGYDLLFHSGCFIQHKETLERLNVENLERLTEKIKGMYRATGRFTGRGNKLEPRDFKYKLKILL